MDCARNISAPVIGDLTRNLAVDRLEEERIAAEEIQRFRIAIPGPRYMVRNLSGGNQQKVLLARWARACNKVLILDEPTRGVDVGAKVEIYRLIRSLADQGVAILMVSSELNELIGMSDRIIVMREGLVTGELAAAETTEDAVIRLATLNDAAGKAA